MQRISICVLMVASAPAFAQDLLPKGAPQTEPIAIDGATVHPVSGEPFVGRVVFDGGEIIAVGKDVAIPNGARVVDASGKHVFPGLIAASSTLGLNEIGSVDMTIDTSEAGSMNAEVYAAVAVNPDSWHIPVARRNGILVAGVFPQGGLVPGRASVMQLDGWTWEEMALERHAGLAVSWPFMGEVPRRFRRFGGGGGNRGEEQVAQLDAFLDAAEAYFAAKEADETVATDLRYEAVRDVVAGERPVFLSVSSREQAESALPWAAERGLEAAVLGGRDVLSYLDLVKRHDVRVAITGTHRLPTRRDVSYASTYELPRLLEEAGVKWCLTGSDRDSSNLRNVPYEAAAAVGYGLSPEAALRSITLSAAEFLGVEDRVGSLDVGKDATLFVSDGDPLELTTVIERAWVQGRSVVLEDKQTQLAEKYRERYRQQGLIGDGK